MVKPGPASKKREIMLEILRLLSQRPYGFRELHRTLPREHRAGSFATLYACTHMLKSEGYIETDPETGRLRITPAGLLERRKQLVINEIIEARVIARYASSSDANPVRYEWTLAKHCENAEQSCNRLPEILRTDTLEANPFFLCGFIWNIIGHDENEGLIDQKRPYGVAWDRFRSELPPEAEILSIVSVGVERLLAWLKTPSGARLLEYVLEQKHESRIRDIATSTHQGPMHYY